MRMFLVPKKTMMLLENREDYTECVECGETVCVSDLLGHLKRYHVEEPCLRDMSKVEEGDNKAVPCSQHAGVIICDVDADRIRICNGILNYVGKEDPLSCVLEHYKIHLDNMVQFVRREHPSLLLPSDMLRLEEDKLRLLARNSSSRLLEPATHQASLTSIVEVGKFTAPVSSSTPVRPAHPQTSAILDIHNLYRDLEKSNPTEVCDPPVPVPRSTPSHLFHSPIFQPFTPPLLTLHTDCVNPDPEGLSGRAVSVPVKNKGGRQKSRGRKSEPCNISGSEGVPPLLQYRPVGSKSDRCQSGACRPFSLLHPDLICDDVILFVQDIILSIFSEINTVWSYYPRHAMLHKKENITV